MQMNVYIFKKNTTTCNSRWPIDCAKIPLAAARSFIYRQISVEVNYASERNLPGSHLLFLCGVRPLLELFHAVPHLRRCREPGCQARKPPE